MVIVAAGWFEIDQAVLDTRQTYFSCRAVLLPWKLSFSRRSKPARNGGFPESLDACGDFEPVLWCYTKQRGLRLTWGIPKGAKL